jgi:hypothetical protein
MRWLDGDARVEALHDFYLSVESGMMLEGDGGNERDETEIDEADQQDAGDEAGEARESEMMLGMMLGI